METEYRRGLQADAWQKLWHFDENCRNFPTRNFALRKDRPSDDELCARCNSGRS